MTPEREARIRRVIRFRQPDLTVVLENIWDPHNVGAILRSADAFGIIDVYLIYNSEIFPVIGKKSSSGTKKWFTFHEFNSPGKCFQELKNAGFRILATHLSAEAVPVHDVDFTGRTAIVFGNETRGVSEEALSLSDGNVIIPQLGFAQSLNVSVAAAIALYEAFRQRRNHLERIGKDESDPLFEKWRKLSQ